MSYYWFDRQEVLQKAKEKYPKEKAAEYYAQNKETIKEKSIEHYKNLPQEEKDKIKEYQRKKISRIGSVQYKKEALQKKQFFVLYLIKKMSEKTLKFNNIRLNKKEFHKSKEPVDLMSVVNVNVDQIVISDKFKPNNEGFKYFIGYQEGAIVKPLCTILP